MEDCCTIRRAAPSEAQTLTEIALRSKAYWNYASTVIEASRRDLTISPLDIESKPFYVLEVNDHIEGFYGLSMLEDNAVDLEYLYIHPDTIGKGYGKMLWRHAIEQASSLGYDEVFIDSEPDAEEFYRAMGAVRIGQSASPVQPGQMLPLLHFSIRSQLT